MSWNLVVEKTNNGFLLKGRHGDTDIDSTMIIEEPENEDGELKTMERVLYEVKEYFGVFYSKHNKENIIIKIEKNKNFE